MVETIVEGFGGIAEVCSVHVLSAVHPLNWLPLSHREDEDLAVSLPSGITNTTTRGVFIAMASPKLFSFAEHQTGTFKVASTILEVIFSNVTGLEKNINITLRLGDPVEYHALIIPIKWQCTGCR